MQKTFQFGSRIKALGNGEIEAVISTSNEDRHGEVLEVKGLDIKNFMKNPVVLFGHDSNALPVAKATSVRKTADGTLIARMQFASDIDPFAAKVHSFLANGFLNAFSIGFIPKEMDMNRFTKSEMIEFSVVPIPANPEALMLAKALVSNSVEKSIIAFQDLPVDEDTSKPWDGPAAVQALQKWASSDGSGTKETIDWNKYRKGFVWYDSSDAQNFGSYKLAIAEVDEGTPKAVFRGVAAAMAALMGARAGLDVPQAERQGIYNHLARYYKKWDRTAPEFKHLDLLGDYLDGAENGLSAVRKSLIESLSAESDTSDNGRSDRAKAIASAKKSAQVVDRQTEAIIGKLTSLFEGETWKKMK